MPYQLDFLSLDSIKRHLSPVERVFYEALNISFASINIKCRPSLQLICISSGSFRLEIYNKKGSRLFKAKVSTAAALRRLLSLILGRFYQFHAVVLLRPIDVTVPWFFRSDGKGVPPAIASLLSAAVDNGVADVRRFELKFADEYVACPCLPAWISRIAPFVRHLQIGLTKSSIVPWMYSFYGGDMDWQVELVTAIGNCHRLLSIDLRVNQSRLPADALLGALASLPALRRLRLVSGQKVDGGGILALANSAPRNSLTLGADWLAAVASQPLMKPFLEKIHHFAISHGWNEDRTTLALKNSDMGPFDSIVSSIGCRRIDVHWDDPSASLKWWPPPSSLNNWLLVAGRHWLTITLIVPALPTDQHFAAIKAAIEGASIAGLEMPLPAYNDQEITFRFHSGAEVRLKLKDAAVQQPPSDH